MSDIQLTPEEKYRLWNNVNPRVAYGRKGCFYDTDDEMFEALEKYLRAEQKALWTKRVEMGEDVPSHQDQKKLTDMLVPLVIERYRQDLPIFYPMFRRRWTQH